MIADKKLNLHAEIPKCIKQIIFKGEDFVVGIECTRPADSKPLARNTVIKLSAHHALQM